jgi:hypothetical protein
MSLFHFMVPEDEIFLCGMALLAGLVLGIVVGLLRPRRRAA